MTLNRHVSIPPQHRPYADLVKELNEMSSRIKVWHTIPEQTPALDRVRDNYTQNDMLAPRWEEVNDLVERCRDTLNQITTDLKKY